MYAKQGVGYPTPSLMQKERNMDQITVMKPWIETLLEKHDLSLYDLCWKQENNMHILQVSIMRRDGTMDIDSCVEMSQLVSALLDEKDVIPGEYYLEVCSPGAERELRSLDEMKQAVGEYVYVKLKDVAAKGIFEVNGTLLEANEDTITVAYMDKTRKKELQIILDNIALIRLAVKL